MSKIKYMTNIELKLKEFLSKHPEIIEDSLKQSSLYFDIIKVNNVEIDDNFFRATVQILEKSSSNCISPFIPIPKNFLRKYKLIEINKK